MKCFVISAHESKNLITTTDKRRCLDLFSIFDFLYIFLWMIFFDFSSSFHRMERQKSKIVVVADKKRRKHLSRSNSSQLFFGSLFRSSAYELFVKTSHYRRCYSASWIHEVDCFVDKKMSIWPFIVDGENPISKSTWSEMKLWIIRLKLGRRNWEKTLLETERKTKYERNNLKNSIENERKNQSQKSILCQNKLNTKRSKNKYNRKLVFFRSFAITLTSKLLTFHNNIITMVSINFGLPPLSIQYEWNVRFMKPLYTFCFLSPEFWQMTRKKVS